MAVKSFFMVELPCGFGLDLGRIVYAGISMSAGLFMVRSFVCYANHPNAPMLQECHLIGSVRLEAMITIARYGRTTRPRPQRANAMKVLFVVNFPPA